MNNFIKWLMRGSFLAFGIVSIMYLFTVAKKPNTKTDGSKEAVILHTVLPVSYTHLFVFTPEVSHHRYSIG